jgi:CRISPR-associated protein Csx17
VSELVLDGCTPEPLMGYLKALGVLRLVSEQTDSDARGCWRDGVFLLETRLDTGGLMRFFRADYRPTPIVVPWSGGDFFGVRDEPPEVERSAKAPTASAIIEAFLATDSPRLEGYRRTIRETLTAMKALGITQKAQIEGTSKKKSKAMLLARLRSVLPDECLGWFDAAVQLADETFAFNALLGRGGGSDGNTHFSDNFMQSLWDCLPEFDEQRSRAGEPPDVVNALFRIPARSLRPKRTASLFDSGAVGGPNAGVGLERDSLLNPWNFILALEGCICFAGAVVKRQQVNRGTSPAFPFSVRMTATGFGSGVDKEQGQNEIWLPLWHRSLSYRELEYLLETGRSEVGRRPARTGLDFARAVGGLGVDAGIDAFARYAIVRGRVGGDNYNTAVSAGLFAVGRNPQVGLLEKLDAWLDRLNRAIDEESPTRFRSARRRIETAIFEFCKSGGPERAAEIVGAIGAAERELAVGGYAQKIPKGGTRPRLNPLSGLAVEWLSAADDGSPEFRLARAVAFLHPGSKSAGPVRRYLEPVERKGDYWAWGQGGGHVVWGRGDLALNLGAVLIRRLMDGEMSDQQVSLLRGLFRPRLEDIAQFLRSEPEGGELDDRKLEDLIWGLSLIDYHHARQLVRRKAEQERQLNVGHPHRLPRPSLPRSYALAKLTLLGAPMGWRCEGKQTRLRVIGLDPASPGVTVRHEPAILARLRAGDVTSAIHVAARRLQASGFMPRRGLLPDGDRRGVDGSFGSVDAVRVLGALLFPISRPAVDCLADLVLRRPSPEALM